MNTPNNRRRRDSQEKIERAFVECLQTMELKKISVSDICKMTKLNRSTFYANFEDVYDLADKVRATLESEFTKAFADFDPSGQQNTALKVFTHIRDNQLFYNTYFKLCYEEKHLISVYDPRQAENLGDEKHLRYHIEFFRNGFNAIVKMWLRDGCRETPEEMAQILKQEYAGRQISLHEQEEKE